MAVAPKPPSCAAAVYFAHSNERILIMRGIARLHLLCALAVLPSALLAQQPDVLVFGAVKDMDTGTALAGSAAEAVDRKWGRWVEVAANDTGGYELGLGRNGEWLVTITAPGYVAKKVLLQLNGPTEEEWVGGFGMEIDMNLMREREGVDYSAMEEPFGISRYNREAGNFEWDMAHTAAMRERQQRLSEAPSAR